MGLTAAVESVSVKSKCTSLASVVTGRPDPVSWLGGHVPPWQIHVGTGSDPAIPLPIGDRLRPVTTEANPAIETLMQVECWNGPGEL